MSVEQDSGKLDKLVRAIGSTRMGVGLMVVLAVICTLATFYEAQHGTAAVQRMFYGTSWFAGLLALLTVSVLLAMIVRWPWNRFHAGFVAAHIGIVLLLVGSLVSLQRGLDATLRLQEGETGNRVFAQGLALHALLPGKLSPVTFSSPIEERAFTSGERRFEAPGSDFAVVVETLAPHVVVVEGVTEGSVPNPALHLTLTGRFGRAEQWLVGNENGHAHASLGPLQLDLVSAADPKAAEQSLSGHSSGARLGFALLPGGRVLYSVPGEGPAKLTEARTGEPIVTPWMGIQVTVDRVLEKAAFRRDVAQAVPPLKLEERLPALKAHLEGPGGRSSSFWLVWGEPEAVNTEAGEVRVAFGSPLLQMPFSVTLLEFRSEKYPGSRMAATYESRVRVDDPQLGSSEHLVSMNHPLHYRGYTLFQSSFAEGERMTSILSVARAPGLPLVYAGTGFIGFGIVFMFYLKPWLVRRQAALALADRHKRGALPPRAAAALAAR